MPYPDAPRVAGHIASLYGLRGIVDAGLAWSPDDKYLYYIDTPTRRVDAFDFDPETGGLSNRRVAFEVPLGMGFPDGMTVDEEGMLWVALWMGWGLGRWDPSSGRLLEKVDVPVARTSCCAFGGRALDKLYITTASIGVEGVGQPDPVLGDDRAPAAPAAGAGPANRIC